LHSPKTTDNKLRMTEWYYASSGKQNGPVSFEQLVEIAKSGNLNPTKDLVWTSTMKDWLPAGQVPGLFGQAASAPSPPVDPSNPYATPTAGWNEVAQITAGETLEEITPGSEPLDAMACIKRGFQLTTRNFGTIALVLLVYMGVNLVAGVVLTAMDSSLGLAKQEIIVPPTAESPQEVKIQEFFAKYQTTPSVPHQIITQLLGVFLSIGVIRIGLNLVSGKEASIGMLFSGANKILPMIGAYIIFGAAMVIGLMLLVVPGIYIAMRYGQFFYAIIDKDMGIIESFKYSSSITTNNRMNLFVLALLYVLVALAGFLALCVGIFFAIPVIYMSGVVAYRWLQYGPRAAQDHHGTSTPMLARL
jgi:uncharacterized membrane protein